MANSTAPVVQDLCNNNGGFEYSLYPACVGSDFLLNYDRTWSSFTTLLNDLDGASLTKPAQQIMVSHKDGRETRYNNLVREIFRLKSQNVDSTTYLQIAARVEDMTNKTAFPAEPSVFSACFVRACNCTVTDGCKEARLLIDGKNKSALVSDGPE